MSRMAHLYERLAAFGINKSYVRGVALPAGWSDRAADNNPAAYAQALGLLAQNLNLDVKILQNDSLPLAWQDCGPARFKHPANVQESDLEAARCLTSRAAQIACHAVAAPFMPLPSSGEAIRGAILQTGESCVTFTNLLDFCWRSGLPILHIARFPVGVKKPDAFAGLFAGRPAIVICRRHRRAAWLLFILAHELGHIAKQHIGEGGLIVDSRVDPENHDMQEEEASTFAVELLTGKPDVYYQARFNLTAEELAQTARMAGQRDGVDPGVIALNYARSKGHYKAGSQALSLIEPDINAVGLIRDRMNACLHWNELPRDSRQFLRRITETEAAG